MNVLPISQQNETKQLKSQAAFKGAVGETLRYLATNQAVGANLVDFSFMVAPRTVNDTVKRGPAAGMETGRREIMGTINDSCVGILGTIAGSLIAGSLSNKFGTKVNKIFTAPDTLHILADNKSRQIKNNNSQLEYLKETLRNVKGYNPTGGIGVDNDGYVAISDKTIDKVAKYFDELLNSKSDFNKWTSSKADKSRTVLMNEIIADTGAGSDYILESTDKKLQSKTNLKSLLNDIFIVSESFNKDKVKDAFNEQIKSGASIKENSFIKGLDKFMKTRAGLGFAASCAIGLSVQPINMYLTKLKTGQDGFVGVEGRSKDNSAGFFGLKALSSVGFFSMILSTLNMNPLKFTPKKFMEKMSFSGKMPTINQLKGIYGITIISRIFSARDKDELREVLTKDTLGYLSWLVLGDFVNRMVASAYDSDECKVINVKKGTEKANYFKKMFYANLKTRDEILVQTLEKQGIKITKDDNGKVVAKTYREMLKDLNGIKDEILKKATKKRLGVLNKAQLAGYAFSGLVLGLGIPNLNIYITNKLDAKRKAAQMKKEEPESLK